jgi:acetyl esterase/lipase
MQGDRGWHARWLPLGMAALVAALVVPGVVVAASDGSTRAPDATGRLVARARAARVASGAGDVPSTRYRVGVLRGVPFTTRLPCAESSGGCVQRADIYYPLGATGPFPTVVTVHGRPRYPSDMAGIARALAHRGAVVFNIDYRGVRPWYAKGFPIAVEDVACGVRFAKRRTARYSGDPDLVVMVLHSQAGQIGSVVALAGDRFPGPRGACLADGGAAPDASASLPDGVVHVAAVSRINPGLDLDINYFGCDYWQCPKRWHRGDVYSYTNRRPEVPFGIIFELHDPFLTPYHVLDLKAALKRGRHKVELILDTTGHTHFDILDVRTELGRRVLALAWRVIDRAARGAARANPAASRRAAADDAGDGGDEPRLPPSPRVMIAS